MRYLWLFLLLPLWGNAQQGLIVTTAGDSLMIEYNKIRAVTAPTRTSRAIITYDLSYIRFEIKASFGAFTGAADCHLFSFVDANTGKWTAIPSGSIDQVKKKSNASNGFVFSEIENARADVVYEFTDDFREVVDTLVACAGLLAGTFPGVVTDMSVTGNGTGAGPIKLVNDEEIPADSYYYGTDTSGNKGWYQLPVGGGGGSWYVTANGDTMNVGAGEYLTFTDSGLVQITFDTLTGEMVFYVAPTNFGSGVDDELAIWLNDTLSGETKDHFIWENDLIRGNGLANRMAYFPTDSTLDETLIEYSSTLWNASALTGSLRPPTGTTAQRPSPVAGDFRYNSDLGDMEFYTTGWRSIVEARAGTFTSGELGYYDASGVLTDTTVAAILSMGGAPTGSGVTNQVAYWSGASTLTGHTNLLWDGTELSVGTTNSAYTLDVGTGGFRMAPQSANPTGASGVQFFDSDDLWFKGYNGTTYHFFSRSDDVDPGANRVWFQNAGNTSQTTSANLTFDGSKLTTLNEKVTGELYINQDDVGDYKIQVTGNSRFGGEVRTISSVILDGANTNINSTGWNDRLGWIDQGLAVRRHDGAGTGGITFGLLAYNGNPGSAFNGSASIWFRSYITGPTSYRPHGRIDVVVGNAEALPANTYGGDLRFWQATDSTQTVLDTTVIVKRNKTVWFKGYGSGTKKGTATYTIATQSNGKLIERAFAYGEMYIDDSDPDTISFAGTTPTQSSDWSSGELQNFTRSNGRLTYTGTETAKFLINYGVSFSFAEGSTDVEGWVYENGSEVAKSEFHRRIETGGDIGNAGSTCIIELATNEYIEFFFAPGTHTGTDDLIIQNANVTITKL